MTEAESIYELLRIMYNKASIIHDRFEPNTPLLPIAPFFEKSDFFSSVIVKDKRVNRSSILSSRYALDMYTGECYNYGMVREFITFSIKLEKYNNSILDIGRSNLIRISLPRLALILLETLDSIRDAYNIDEEQVSDIKSNIVKLLSMCRTLVSFDQNYRSILYMYNINSLDYSDNFKSALIEIIVSENNSCFYVADTKLFKNTLINLLDDLIKLLKMYSSNHYTIVTE